MKEIFYLTLFLIVILIISSVSIFFVTQNTQLISLNFFNLYLPEVSTGVAIVISFFSGVIFMWILLLIVYFTTLSRLRNELKNLKKQKEELENKIKSLTGIEDKQKKETKDAEKGS